MKVGIAVYCGDCHRMKKPRGRSAPVEMDLCDHDCEGYNLDPQPGCLWPRETELDFGYRVGPHGWADERAAFAQLQADYNSSQQTVRELQRELAALKDTAWPATCRMMQEMRDEARTERDELRIQLAKRTFERDDASQSCDVMQAERDCALSELADARKDTERLDWLAANARESGFYGNRWVVLAEDDVILAEANTYRDAIDAARAATDPATPGSPQAAS